MSTTHTIITGDSRSMDQLQDGSVQLIVTSPPYWQLKDYGSKDQIGYHGSYEEYINDLNLVWQECDRVLSPGCRLCINIGDQFARTVYYGRYKVIPIRTEIIRFCEALGAQRAIDYKTQDFVAEILEATDGRGVNVILDMVGGKYLARNLQALAVEGRLVMIATQGGTKGEVDVLHVMQRRLTVTGSTLRAREVAFKQRIKAQLLSNAWPLIEQGRIKPIIDSMYSMSEVARAHERMESSAHMGKILLIWGAICGAGA